MLPTSMEAEVRRTACKLGISQRQKMKKLTLDLAAGKVKTHNVSNDFGMAIGKKQYVGSVKQNETAVRIYTDTPLVKIL